MATAYPNHVVKVFMSVTTEAHTNCNHLIILTYPYCYRQGAMDGWNQGGGGRTVTVGGPAGEL